MPTAEAFLECDVKGFAQRQWQVAVAWHLPVLRVHHRAHQSHQARLFLRRNTSAMPAHRQAKDERSSRSWRVSDLASSAICTGWQAGTKSPERVGAPFQMKNPPSVSRGGLTVRATRFVADVAASPFGNHLAREGRLARASALLLMQAYVYSGRVERSTSPLAVSAATGSSSGDASLITGQESAALPPGGD